LNTIPGVADQASRDRFYLRDLSENEARSKAKQKQDRISARGNEGKSLLYQQFPQQLLSGTIDTTALREFLAAQGFEPEEIADAVIKTGSEAAAIGNFGASGRSPGSPQEVEYLNLVANVVGRGYEANRTAIFDSHAKGLIDEKEAENLIRSAARSEANAANNSADTDLTQLSKLGTEINALIDTVQGRIARNNISGAPRLSINEKEAERLRDRATEAALESIKRGDTPEQTDAIVQSLAAGAYEEAQVRSLDTAARAAEAAANRQRR
jgi:hypothetical protein